ncbi:hypothetical protein [Furfurilactobacillus siliginis]|uniref:Beta-1,6-galactofuranosyltransferase n=1 Tax=Furfurilactobacillus siliginis TaxID=348151 RepID=A0A0R2KX70_9LACO|nr:hypothetical protein [Furfurilactobacillus siliginis]KRN94098.1 hypothetical protein IV55_GL000610 [Furfurilactobacillus siliginis]GEK29472.1 beta-1,6-galactofuranosyltransferase [Furfurilactobacillus siliginis]
MAIFTLRFNGSAQPGFPYWDSGASGKYRFDRERFAVEIGASYMDAFIYEWNDEPADMLNSRLAGITSGLKKNDAVLVDWPFPNQGTRWVQALFDNIHAFGAKIVIVIDDLYSLRMDSKLPKLGDEDGLQRYLADNLISDEVVLISQADGLIVHSTPMYQYLKQELQLVNKTITTNVAAYGPGGNKSVHFQGRRVLSDTIDYAGNLNFAQFLYDLPETFQINVFGNRESDNKLADHTNINMHPYVDPEAINHLLSGSFGLVWNSTTYPFATGNIAEYTKYNTEAKLSMYLAADEPVIVWSQASFAKFVADNQVGIVIDDLSQLPDKLAQITAADYDALIDNVQRISPQIRSGFFFKKAVFDVLGKIYDFSDSTAVSTHDE